MNCLPWLFLLCSSPCYASFTRVNAYQSNGGAATIVYTSAAAGNLLVYQTLTYAFPVTSVNGDNGNTWIHATSAQCQNATITEYADTFYVLSATAGTTTATPVTSASFGHMTGVEYHYTGPSIGFDLATCGSGSGASSSLSLTTTYNNELLTAIATADSGTVTAAPSGWANLQTSTDSYNSGHANLLDASTNGAKTANFTFSGSSNWVETYATFRDDTMTGGGTTLKTLLTLGAGDD